MNFRSLVVAVVFLVLANPSARAQSATTTAACTAGTAAGAACVAPTPLAATDFDGIWAIQSATTQQLRDASYFSLRATDSGLLVVIRLGSADWQAYVTALSGNSATVVTITTQAINSWRIDFASAQKATITGLICVVNSTGGGPLPLAATPTVGSTAASGTDAALLPISIASRCFVPQGATFALSKLL